MRRGFTVLCLTALSLLLFVPTAGAMCIKRHSVAVASGSAPNGSHWNVGATIGPNGGGCRDWLLGAEFEIPGAGFWSTSTGIPVGGHIGRGYEIDASDMLLQDGSDRVFAGVVSGEVAKVLVTLSDNHHLAFRPKAPPEHLRRINDWLRDFRYLVEYYPPEGFVTGVATFSKSGQLLYRDKTFEGF